MKNLVKNVKGVEFLTGKRTKEDANEIVKKNLLKPFVSKNWEKHEEAIVKGTDLGIPFYNSKNDSMYVLFGDTYGIHTKAKSCEDDGVHWRSSVMGISKGYNLSHGLTFDEWWSNGSNVAEAIIEGKHFDTNYCISTGVERTKIPQGGIEIDGTIYVFYESIRNFAPGGTWVVNYQGVIKSTDNCKSFERVYDLTWFPNLDSHSEYAIFSAGESWEDATNIDVKSEEDITPKMLELTKSKIANAYERRAPYFAQCYPVDGYDGYIYIFGRRAGRQHGIKSARVKRENIEVFAEYEYYLGNDSFGNPIWKKGYEGLKALDNDSVGYVLTTNEDEPASNMSVMFNKYLNKWMLVYFRPKKVDESGNIVYPNSVGFRLSDTPYGNYGEYHTILTEEFFKEEDHYTFMEAKWNFNSTVSPFYGAFVHEKYTEDNGKSFYLILSLAGAIYNSILLKVELE